MKKVVTIGGGSGSYAVLSGLKAFDLDITAVVSMFDSGGSTGVLRDEFGVLPPGDVRRCLIALSEGERATILRDLFNFRFNGGSTLSGHSFGNLFLTALTSIYGSDIEAIRKASEVLDIKGRVLPVSLDSSHVHATLEDGTEIVGETNIDEPKHDGNLRIVDVVLSPPARIYEETADAIRTADIVVVAPGDLYTSLVPNLLVEGMKEALAASKAKKVFVCSLMTKWGETNGFAASDFVKELLRYSGLDMCDYVICNTEEMPAELTENYAKEQKHPLVCDKENLKKYAKNVITGDFFSSADIARHDPEKIGRVISEL
ncbi:YvcK family protein [Candidatus Parcubacteria bacterium]|nr:MAG: YvcK family protein [Candidatus Parcubacteria bacterium]